MKDLYDILGLPRDARTPAIKHAWRVLSQQRHPDREGGDEEKFKEVQRAYEVLSNPATRAHYDATGKLEDPAAIRQRAEEMIPEIVEGLLAREDAHELLDFTFLVRNVLLESTATVCKAKDADTKRRKKLQKVLNRFKRRDGENLVAKALEAKVQRLDQGIATAERYLLELAEAQQVLNDYTYDTSPAVADGPSIFLTF